MHIGMDTFGGSVKSKYQGFTLLELMIVLALIGVIAAIAIPSYDRYVRSAERGAAESQMLTLAADLERWKGKSLSYAGFVPAAGYESSSGSYGNMSILIPKGSTASSFSYRILIMDSACRSTLNPITTIDGCAGQSWVMVARPNSGDSTDTATSTGRLGSASRLVLDNQGVRCMTPGEPEDHIKDMDIGFGATPVLSNSDLCGTASKPW